MKILHGKLIRDRIPEILTKKGISFQLEEVAGEKLLAVLKQKLLEEAQEADDASSREELLAELADLQEVIDALLVQSKSSAAELRRLQDKKRAERGAFEKGFCLLWTEKPEQ